ncbi:hypothetical protein OAD28_00005 [Flavobacteriales bacterium]|nr:hypothetical protein [Flavobacteriales bacterium]
MGFGTSLLYDSYNTFTIGSNLILRNDKKLNFEIGLATSLLVNYNAGLDDEERRIMAEGGSWYCHPLLTLFSTLNIGMRYNFENNWFVKLNYSPAIYRRINHCTTPRLHTLWGGFSIGKRF